MLKPLLIISLLSIPALFFSIIIEYNWPETSVEYHIQISTNENFIRPVVDDFVTATNYIADLAEGRYFARIAPVFREVEGQFTRLVAFTLSENDSNRLVNLTPVTAELMPDIQTRLKWICRISNNSPIASDSSLIYSIDDNLYKSTTNRLLEIDPQTLPEGQHRINYYIVNPLGAESRLSNVIFIVDRTPPEIRLYASHEKRIGDRSYLFRDSIIRAEIDDRLSDFQSYFGVNGKSVPGLRYAVNGLTNHIKVRVFAKDNWDNSCTVNQEYFLDFEPPVIHGKLNGKEMVYTNLCSPNDIVRFQITDNIKVAFTKIILDDQTNQGESELPLRNLSEGNHRLSVAAEDIFGNRSTQNWEILIDDQPPSAEVRIIHLDN